MIHHYEGMFLTHNKEGRKDSVYLEEHVRSLIEKSGGTVAQLKKWDERKLAYQVKGVTHGVYVLSYFSGEGDAIARLRGEVRLSSLVLRHLTLKLDKLPETIETYGELQQRLSTMERREADVDPRFDTGRGFAPAGRPRGRMSEPEPKPVGGGDDDPGGET